jgi:hypothetical protein
MFTKKNVLRGIMLLVVSFACHVAQAVGNPAVLFSDSKGAKPQNMPKNIDDARVGYVRANIGALFNSNWKKPKSKDQLPEIRFDLFPGISFMGVVTYAEHYADAGIGHWEGVLKNEKGQFSVSASKDGIVSSVRTEKKGTFEINCDKSYLCKIAELDTKK